MTGISNSSVYSVSRIRSQFADDLGNTRTIQGTGFWIARTSGAPGFVTNKHNVDPKMKLGNSSRYELRGIHIELRRAEGETIFSETKFFEIDRAAESLHLSETADCAVLINPVFLNRPDDFKPVAKLLESEIADEQFLKDKVAIMDFASFIGYPGNSGKEWWDQKFNFPIARMCSISSLPEVPFVNDAIPTGDVTLVSGFSFAGSSGSPVILHQKSIKVDEETLHNPFYVPPRVIGIMSGHMIDIVNQESMFDHTGLSYFTRSTSIRKVLDSIN